LAARPDDAAGQVHRAVLGQIGADAIDAQLHGERLDADGYTQRHHDAAYDSLRDAALVLRDGDPWLVLGHALTRWTAGGYAERVTRPTAAPALVITRAIRARRPMSSGSA